MKVLEIEGRTVDDATRKALNELRVSDPAQLNIEVMDQGKSGIFGFGVSRPAKIRVYYSDTTVDVGEITRTVLTTMLEKMDVEGHVRDIKESENKVYVELESSKSGLVIGKKGATSGGPAVPVEPYGEPPDEERKEDHPRY